MYVYSHAKKHSTIGTIIAIFLWGAAYISVCVSALRQGAVKYRIMQAPSLLLILLVKSLGDGADVHSLHELA